ncbi:MULTISPECIES: fimbrial protein [unclassified Serratia (in: enterobacteria)]|uniref:fimbrial protein n=1 Tax=unclassified Serratia (in: enterobacteria) TaxID=2647522 RepID=UPI0004696E50|nr:MULTISPECIES: fimbrial protein [unclassified Serratia (in: enterobacteria)]
MLSINNALNLLAAGLLMSISHSSWAVKSCALKSGMSSASLTVPLSPPVISAGADVPIGTIIYQGSWSNAPLVSVDCPSDGNVGVANWAVAILQAPYALSGLNTGPFAGAVYQTSIPGIGVVISRYNNRAAATLGTMGYRDEDVEIGTLGGEVNFSGATRYISLIKTGPLTPGSYSLSAASLPTASDNMVNSRTGVAIPGLPIQLNRVTFQGNLTISTQTCTTPDVTVDLGSHDIREKFRGINSTSPWVDASIMLTNCPTFFGFYNQTNTTRMMDFDSGVGTTSQSINNSIGVRLAPVTTVIDSANGIMAIDATRPDAASGVGIQIGWGDSGQTPIPFNFAAEQTVVLPKDGSPTIRVPLAARYIQTAGNPTPGKADGKVTFTVNYY